MVVTIKTAHGYLSAQPGNPVKWEYRKSVGTWEQFDIEGLELPPVVPPVPPTPEPPPVVNPPEPLPTVPTDPQEFFQFWVEGKPFGQKTLLDLESTFNAYGWQLTPPNAAGDRTKIKPPNGPWIRVGFGEGHWVWIPQS